MHLQSVDRQSAKNVVKSKLAELSAKSFDELAALPSQTDEMIVSNGADLRVAVWCDSRPSTDEIVIAVQVFQSGMLGVGRMHAEGFVINRRNEQRPLTLDEWAPFS